MVLAAGADFRTDGHPTTQVKSTKPVVSICAVRTGSGKSQTTRRVSSDSASRWVSKWQPSGTPCLMVIWSSKKYNALPPMPTLTNTNVPLRNVKNTNLIMDNGVIVYAGVDYEAILRQAEQEVDIVLWDGGNNDFLFLQVRFEHCGCRSSSSRATNKSYHPW